MKTHLCGAMRGVIFCHIFTVFFSSSLMAFEWKKYHQQLFLFATPSICIRVLNVNVGAFAFSFGDFLKNVIKICAKFG